MITLAIFLPLIASFLSFFSGFGLNTLLLPFFMLLLYPEQAIAVTGIIHFLNNIFKLILLYKNIDLSISLIFGLPAMIFAYFGVWALKFIVGFNSIFSYDLFGERFAIKPINITLGLLMMAFSLYDILPSPSLPPSKAFLPLGGILSGFFGGLSGHQGAFRSLFLLKFFSSTKGFIATGVAIACLVDMIRLSFYEQLGYFNFDQHIWLVLISLFSAFLGSFIGNIFIKKITIQIVQKFVGIFLFLAGSLIAAGII